MSGNARVMLSNKSLLDIIAMTPDICLKYDEKGKIEARRQEAIETLPVKLPRKTWQTVNGENSDNLLIRFLQLNPGAEIQLLDHEGEQEPYFVIRMRGIPNWPKGVRRKGEYLQCCCRQSQIPVKIAKIQIG